MTLFTPAHKDAGCTKLVYNGSQDCKVYGEAELYRHFHRQC